MYASLLLYFLSFINPNLPIMLINLPRFTFMKFECKKQNIYFNHFYQFIGYFFAHT